VHFTRDPIIESVITPREGCKLVVRNSKGIGQEEYFVDAIEVVNFGQNCFFRSLERPKAFLVPSSDYEILEVRETRVVLKHAAAAEKSIKLVSREKAEAAPARGRGRKEKEEAAPERKKERRKRRRRGSEEKEGAEAAAPEAPAAEPTAVAPGEEGPVAPLLTSRIIPPPKTLISESISRYKELLTGGTGENGSPGSRFHHLPQSEETPFEETPD
jgi:hypothetical protein